MLSGLDFGVTLDSLLGHLRRFVADTGQIQEDFHQSPFGSAQSPFGSAQSPPGSVSRWPSGLDFGITLEPLLGLLS